MLSRLCSSYVLAWPSSNEYLLSSLTHGQLLGRGYCKFALRLEKGSVPPICAVVHCALPARSSNTFFSCGVTRPPGPSAISNDRICGCILFSARAIHHASHRLPPADRLTTTSTPRRSIVLFLHSWPPSLYCLARCRWDRDHHLVHLGPGV